MSTCPAELNFASHLAELNAARAGKTAYIDDSRRLSYGELAERVARFAGLLQGLGLRREERVLLLQHDTVDWPVAFLGALGLARQESTRTAGYSQTPGNSRGARKALKPPPTTPPIDIHR